MGMTFDGETKVITLTVGTTTVSVRDLWSRWIDWFLTADNSKYLPAFAQVGGDDIDASAGTKIPIYAFLVNGWKIKPQEANHTLTISDGILLVDGGGDPFNNTEGYYIVRINYQQPVQAISFSSGGGTSVWTTEEKNIILSGTSAIASSVNVVLTGTSALLNNVSTLLNGTSMLLTHTGSLLSNTSALLDHTGTIKQANLGHWKLADNQLIMYGDNEAEIARFNLFDRFGEPTMEDVFERVLVV